MIGAIAGDIAGSIYESGGKFFKDEPLFEPGSRFTDDTILTAATADAILNDLDFDRAYRKWGRRYPDAGYGGYFYKWLMDEKMGPYNSWGNGSAMRVSPAGFAARSIKEALQIAESSAEVTHNHPQGIKGARAVASAVYLAKDGKKKKYIKKYIEKNFGYELNFKMENLREKTDFDVSCRGTVPVALFTFMESENYEDALRKALSIGGDSDTLACITGSVAQAFYKYIPDYIVKEAKKCLTEEIVRITDRFCKKFNVRQK